MTGAAKLFSSFLMMKKIRDFEMKEIGEEDHSVIFRPSLYSRWSWWRV